MEIEFIFIVVALSIIPGVVVVPLSFAIARFLLRFTDWTWLSSVKFAAIVTGTYCLLAIMSFEISTPPFPALNYDNLVGPVVALVAAPLAAYALIRRSILRCIALGALTGALVWLGSSAIWLL